jgi:hypothetical protein
MDVDPVVQAIGPADLTNLVRQAFGAPTLDIVEWTCRMLHGGVQSGGVYRFEGTARRQAEHVGWSVVLKVLPAAPESADPSFGVYWKREALAYQSGLLANLPGGLAAPGCFAVVQYPNAIGIWLEDVGDGARSNWSLERFGLAARHLGTCQGPI